MPSEAVVYGTMQSAPGVKVVGGKAVATLAGSDIFDGGTTITTYQVEATTNDDGEWEVPLIVNGEGKDATTTWTVELFDQFAKSVAKHTGLFIAGPARIDLGDLRRALLARTPRLGPPGLGRASPAKAANAKSAAAVRFVTADSREEYDEWPEGQKQLNDVVLVPGV